MFGRTTRRNTVSSPAPSERAASSISVSSSISTGCTVRTTNGSVTNSSATRIAAAREREVDPDRRARPVERQQQQPGHDRRQRERQVDDRVHDRLAAEVVADEHPRGDRPEHRVRGAAIAASASVSFSAAIASGFVTASQKPPPPFFAAAQVSAAIGSATTTSRKVVTKPSERAAAGPLARLVGCERPPGRAAPRR